jgi:hypothetical protein
VAVPFGTILQSVLRLGQTGSARGRLSVVGRIGRHALEDFRMLIRLDHRGTLT